jgi:hypothetical protein
MCETLKRESKFETVPNLTQTCVTNSKASNPKYHLNSNISLSLLSSNTQPIFLIKKPTNALTIVYWSHVHVSVAFCDHPQAVQY